MAENTAKTNDEKKSQTKKKYVKPEIQSEDLISFGALCNGTSNGGRKVTTVACNSRKLNS